MSIFPILQRRGSLLVPAGTGWSSASAATKSNVEPRMPRRKAYSEYRVLSPSVGAVMVRNRLQEALLAWADTEPGVVDVSMVNRTVTFFDGKKNQTTKIPLMVRHIDGAVSYWDGADARMNGGHMRAAILAKREFAEAQNAEYRAIPWTFFAEHRSALSSRLAWQNILYSGLEIATTDLESKVLLTLLNAPASVCQLAVRTGSDDFAALVAVARLWRAGKIVFAIGDALPGMQLQVMCGGAYGR